jgi:hypothetical protein
MCCSADGTMGRTGLKEIATLASGIDWFGNLTFAGPLLIDHLGIRYGTRPPAGATPRYSAGWSAACRRCCSACRDWVAT